MSSRSTPVRTASLWLALLGSTGALALAGTAFAQGWGTYEQAFPANPCHDGWSACIVDGERVSPDMSAKGPSDMRVGWFDLEPSSSFSPFTGLTEYTGEAPAVAAAEPEPVAADDGGAGELPAGDDGFDGAASAPSEESVKAQQDADEAAVAKAAQRAAADDARRAEEEAAQAQRDAQKAAAQAVKEEQSRRKEADRLAAQAAQAESAQQDALRKEAEVARKAADDAERKRKEAERQEADRRAAQEDAKRKSDEQERRRQEADAAAKAAEEEARRSAEEDRKRREAEDAERRAEQERVAAEKAEQERIAAEKAAADKAEQERLAAEAAAADGAAAAPPPPAPEDDGTADVATAPPPPVDDGSCDNFQALEPPAMLGKMSDGQVQCLEGRLSQASKMTDKKKISVLLMTNAFSKGDKKKWEDLVKRHLDEIDQSDPDLCYKYALYLAGRGSSRASGVIRWANVALENRTVWTGDTYKSRVNSLFKMRAAASQSLWASAEKEHAASPSDATASKIDKYRNMTKVNAREWYEYAKMSGKDTTKPLQLCMSAAGTSDYCDGG